LERNPGPQAEVLLSQAEAALAGLERLNAETAALRQDAGRRESTQAEDRVPPARGPRRPTAEARPGGLRRFEVHLTGEEKWKEVLAESIRITDTEPREIHFEGSKPHIVYYLHALSQPVTELSERMGPVGSAFRGANVTM
jgi:hypothetical protein